MQILVNLKLGVYVLLGKASQIQCNEFLVSFTDRLAYSVLQMK